MVINPVLFEFYRAKVIMNIIGNYVNSLKTGRIEIYN